MTRKFTRIIYRESNLLNPRIRNDVFVLAEGCCAPSRKRRKKAPELYRDQIKSTLQLFVSVVEVQFHAKTRIRYATLAYLAANEVAIAARVTPYSHQHRPSPAATDIESYCNKLDFNLTRLQTCSRGTRGADWTAAR